MKKRILTLSCILGSVWLVGCGDGDGVSAPPSTTSLTEAQAAAVFDTVFETGSDSDAKLSVRAHTETIPTEERDCPGGGTVQVKGEADVESSDDALEAAIDLTAKYTDCVTHPVDGDPIVLNGTLAFDMDLDGEKDGDGGTLDIRLELVGSLDITGDGVKEGTCGIGLLAKAESDFTLEDDELSAISVEASVDGSICGESISDKADVNVGG